MAQFSWTYLGGHGKKFRVGLYHGTATGHVLIHCNSRIMLIDFGVRQTKTYNFFLDEELCEIILERKGNQFFYEFKVNDQVDTPLNRRRRQLDRKHWKQSLLFFGGVLLLAGIFVAIFMSLRSGNGLVDPEEYLKKSYKEALAVIQPHKNGDETLTIEYSFVSGNRVVKSSMENISSSELRIGMPLESGDEFLVKYAPGRPTIHLLDLERPSEIQIEKYYRRALQKHLAAHPELTRRMARCQVDVAYSLRGIAGLADFYYQKVKPAQNPLHNRSTFLRLTRDAPFRNKVAEQCWD